MPVELEKAKIILKLLLNVDPKLRLSAEEALYHPFLLEDDNDERRVVSKLHGESSDESLREYIMKKVKNFWK